MELLAVIVVLAIVAVIGTTTVLPLLSDSQEQAFRVEATSAVKSAEEANNLVTLGKRSYANDTNSCKVGNKICLTIDTLIDWGTYTGEKGSYKGKVEYDTSTNVYTLYFYKNAEYTFINTQGKNYNNEDIEISNSASWQESYEKCSC